MPPPKPPPPTTTTNPNRPPPPPTTLSAALTGATLAFGRTQSPNPPPAPPPRKPPGHSPTNGPNGALLAATHATGGSSPGAPLSRNVTGGSDQLQLPLTPGGGGRGSASYIAATLAASRSGSPSPSPRPVQARVTPRRGGGVAGGLIEMFEGRRGEGGDPVKRGGVGTPSVVVREATVEGGEGGGSPTRHAKGKKPPVVGKKPRVVSAAGRPDAEVVSPKPRRITETPRLEPPGLPVRAEGSTPGGRRRTSLESASSDDSFVSASSTQSPRAQSPAPPPPNLQPGKQPSRQPSPNLPPPRPSPSQRASPVPRHTKSPSTSTLALDSLTNAMVASNLASARHTSSPAPPPPVPAPRRHRPRSPQHDTLLLPFHRSGGSNHSPGSAKGPPPPRTGMLQTLRAPPKSLSDDEDARRHQHRHRKKPMGGRKHAHAEGSRRRWRDEVSPRERRRYEAVWASNRGLFLRPGWAVGEGDGRAAEGTPEAELVVNVVVRDLWSRSRLPGAELEEVWALVDRRGDGSLGREEFVVGMWLIDQRLRGRKIPARVGESVWASVRGARVTVPAPPKGRKGRGRRG
ncbi:hypothetical protein QBC39DRAFT_437865 [Podospora conica]|nr:hypothetical protein QBC39DRAFT_437865 [Schizothecium conicum]